MFQLGLKKILRTQRGRLNNLAILLIANVFTAGIGFITTIKIANILGPEKFGELAYALSVGGIIAVNVRYGLDQSLIRDLTHSPKRFGEFLASSILLRAMLLCIVLLGLFVLRGLGFEGVQLLSGALLVVIATALTPFQIANLFDVLEKQGRHALYSLTERIIYFMITWWVILLIPDRLSILWIGSALLIGIVFCLIIQYLYAWQQVKSKMIGLTHKKIFCTSLTLLKSNKWLWLASIATLGVGSFTNVLLKQISGASDLGIFAASFQIIALGTLLLKNISRIGRPLLAKRTTNQAIREGKSGRFLLLYLLLTIAATSLVAIPAIVFPKFIIQTLFTSEYATSYWILRLMGIYLFVRAAEFILGQFIVLAHMDKIYLLTRVFSGSIGLLSAAVLITKYSGIGAACSMVIGVTVGTILCAIATVFHILQAQKTFITISDK